jgi:hypothetical protein
MDFVDFVAEGLVYRDVAIPTRFTERWRGMRSAEGAMLFTTRSVHGFGMDRELTVVAIDRRHRVIAVQRLEPGGLIVIPAAGMLLELEVTMATPSIGDEVRFYDRRHGGTTRGVRHADRQPRRHIRASGGDAAGG